MISFRSELVLDLAIILCIVGVQLYLFRSARRAALRSRAAELEIRRESFVADIERRAHRGSSPDWMRYRAEIDRLLEPVDDRLRVLSAAALATGLGGTILALIAHLLIAARGTGLEPGTVILGMGVALFGSLAGVVNHLGIALHLLPTAERRFQADAEAVLRALRDTEEEHPPAEGLVQRFQDELGSLRDVLGSEFSGAFADAVPEFPRVVERLAEAVEKQASTIDGAVGDLRESSKLVADGSKRLRPTAKRLADASEHLVALPERLADVLSATRQGWLEEIHAEQRKANLELVETVKELRVTWENREADLVDRVDGILRGTAELPAAFAERIHDMAGELGREFGGEARAQNRQLANDLARENEALRSHLEDQAREWRSDFGEAVRRLMDELESQVEARFVERLNGVAGALEGTAARLKEGSDRLETANREWREAQTQALAGWREVGTKVDDAAQRLAGGEADLERAVVALGEGAGHLERIATVSKGFEAALRESLREVTERYLEELRPVSAEMGKMMVEMVETRGRFDSILGEQGELIRQLIRQILAGRGLVTTDGAEAEA